MTKPKTSLTRGEREMLTRQLRRAIYIDTKQISSEMGLSVADVVKQALDLYRLGTGDIDNLRHGTIGKAKALKLLDWIDDEKPGRANQLIIQH